MVGNDDAVVIFYIVSVFVLSQSRVQSQKADAAELIPVCFMVFQVGLGQLHLHGGRGVEQNHQVMFISSYDFRFSDV